jgi:hypothetical protein
MGTLFGFEMKPKKDQKTEYMCIEESRSNLRGKFCHSAEPGENVLAVTLQRRLFELLIE